MILYIHDIDIHMYYDCKFVTNFEIHAPNC